MFAYISFVVAFVTYSSFIFFLDQAQYPIVLFFNFPKTGEQVTITSNNTDLHFGSPLQRSWHGRCWCVYGTVMLIGLAVLVVKWEFFFDKWPEIDGSSITFCQLDRCSAVRKSVTLLRLLRKCFEPFFIPFISEIVVGCVWGADAYSTAVLCLEKLFFVRCVCRQNHRCRDITK